MQKVHDRFIWTSHALIKMRHYRLSPARVKQVIRHPSRVEEGIAKDTIAVMSPSGDARGSEIWVMYKLERRDTGKLKIIAAWRYPAKSPQRNPIPMEILLEVSSIIGV